MGGSLTFLIFCVDCFNEVYFKSVIQGSQNLVDPLHAKYSIALIFTIIATCMYYILYKTLKHSNASRRLTTCVADGCSGVLNEFQQCDWFILWWLIEKWIVWSWYKICHKKSKKCAHKHYVSIKLAAVINELAAMKFCKSAFMLPQHNVSWSGWHCACFFKNNAASTQITLLKP